MDLFGFLSGLLTGALLPLLYRIFDHVRLKAKIDIYNSWCEKPNNGGTAEGKDFIELKEYIDNEVASLKSQESKDERAVYILAAIILCIEAIVCVLVSASEGWENWLTTIAAIVAALASIGFLITPCIREHGVGDDAGGEPLGEDVEESH